MIADPQNSYDDIRDAVRALCTEFPDEYHRKVDEERGYGSVLSSLSLSRQE